MKRYSHELTGLMVAAAAVLSALAGCGASGGLLQRAGIADPSDVRMVVFQGAGYGHLPMNPTYPLRGTPASTTDAAQIKAFYDAVNNPDGKAWTRQARNNRLAFVTKSGRVIMFGFGGGRPVKGQGPDITAKHSSAALMTAMLGVARAKRQPAVLPKAQISSIRLNSGKQLTPADPQFAKSEALWLQLIGCYSPLNLKGNTRCSSQDLQASLRRAPQCLEVTLSKPARFEAIILPANATWPPDYYDSNGASQTIQYDRAYALDVPIPNRAMFPNVSRLVRFAFVDSKTNDCLITDPIDPRRVAKKAHGRQPAVYGPDLFGEAVSAVRWH